MAAASEDTTTKRTEKNRTKRIAARRALERLLAMAETPDFSGSITVEVAVDRGVFGRIRQATNAYEH